MLQLGWSYSGRRFTRVEAYSVLLAHAGEALPGVCVHEIEMCGEEWGQLGAQWLSTYHPLEVRPPPMVVGPVEA